MKEHSDDASVQEMALCALDSLTRTGARIENCTTRKRSKTNLDGIYEAKRGIEYLCRADKGWTSQLNEQPEVNASNMHADSKFEAHHKVDMDLQESWRAHNPVSCNKMCMYSNEEAHCACLESSEPSTACLTAYVYGLVPEYDAYISRRELSEAANDACNSRAQLSEAMYEAYSNRRQFSGAMGVDRSDDTASSIAGQLGIRCSGVVTRLPGKMTSSTKEESFPGGHQVYRSII